MATAAARIPAHVLTGFLGSGKTTLLNRLLQDPLLGDCAVLINEFGAVGVDHHLVDRVEGDMVLLASGCICCTVRGDLAQALRALYARREAGSIPAFNRVVIETTGLADPVPVLATLMFDRILQSHFEVGSVVTTVDALNGAANLQEFAACRKQATSADRLVLTKLDLADPHAAQALRQDLQALNPAAQVVAAGDAQCCAALPLIAPSLVGIGMFGFTLSWDEIARTSQAIGDVNTLPLELQGLTTTVTTPAIYALGTVTMVVSFCVIGLALLLGRVLARRQAQAHN